MTTSAHDIGPMVVDPRPDAWVFPAERARPGLGEEEVPRFGDERWQLAAMDHSESSATLAFDWTTVPEPLRTGLKRAAWALINIATPQALLSRYGSSARARLSPASVLKTVQAWKFFALWLHERHVHRLDQVDQALMEEYAHGLTGRGIGHGQAGQEMFCLSRLWAYGLFLPPGHRLPTPPWLDVTPEEFLGTEAGRDTGENRTTPVHPEVMSPLLLWSLRTVTDLAPDILAAWRHEQYMLARISERATPGGRDRIRAYLRQLRESGGELPTYRPGHRISRAVATINQRRRRPKAGRRCTAW